MHYLYNSETIYKIADAKKMDSDKNHSIILLCRNSDLSNGGSELLAQIMGALNLSLEEDYTMIVLNDTEAFDFSSCLQNGHSNLVFSFGLEEKELCIQAYAPFYSKARFENATLIRSHSIKELKENKNYKGSLWSVIKEYKKES